MNLLLTASVIILYGLVSCDGMVSGLNKDITNN